MMKAILAVNKKGYIGLNGSLPWRCSEDLKHFKELTMGGMCLVGRTTWETLPPLSGREIAVLTSNPENTQRLSKKDTTDILFTNNLKLDIDWVIGGKTVYEKTLEMCSELHISVINDYTEGDTECPDLSKFKGEIFVYNFEPNVKK